MEINGQFYFWNLTLTKAKQERKKETKKHQLLKNKYINKNDNNNNNNNFISVFEFRHGVADTVMRMKNMVLKLRKHFLMFL